ncbi:Protein PER1 [Hypsizygus marmoreus]|uniref:Post-GPI attachment to proteins factor 3 n=1 Tax=Hypsizygus marmoreus TaxID=39966 RepID=A0A369JYD6_HYPMA|nr:Protein PER1 [Hypsizygus marmoreus]
MRSNAYFLFVTTLFGIALASSGDRSFEFGNCVELCTTKHCQGPSVSLPLALRLTRWTCEDDCKYSCMHEITDRDVERGIRIQQYYGKWPFWRLAGVQEPASVAFSLLNLWSHVHGAREIQKRIPNAHPMKRFYLIGCVASINAWIWSSVFHTRDLPTTEKLDYFSAALTILYALYCTVVRLFHLYPKTYRSRVTLSSVSSTPHNASRVYTSWSLLCIIVYIVHVSYLTLLPRFDYTYNMAFNLIIGFSHNALWLIYALPTSVVRRFPTQPKSYRPSFVGKAGVFVVLMTAATTLELFDFPPWGRIIDAHSLWHLSTAPIAMLWYTFLIEDALDGSWREQRL